MLTTAKTVRRIAEVTPGELGHRQEDRHQDDERADEERRQDGRAEAGMRMVEDPERPAALAEPVEHAGGHDELGQNAIQRRDHRDAREKPALVFGDKQSKGAFAGGKLGDRDRADGGEGDGGVDQRGEWRATGGSRAGA